MGWKNVIWKSQATEDLAFDRASVCADCPHNINNSCDLCGCPLIAKTRNPDSKCPENKWKL